MKTEEVLETIEKIVDYAMHVAKESDFDIMSVSINGDNVEATVIDKNHRVVVTFEYQRTPDGLRKYKLK